MLPNNLDNSIINIKKILKYFQTVSEKYINADFSPISPMLMNYLAESNPNCKILKKFSDVMPTFHTFKYILRYLIPRFPFLLDSIMGTFNGLHVNLTYLSVIESMCRNIFFQRLNCSCSPVRVQCAKELIRHWGTNHT